MPNIDRFIQAIRSSAPTGSSSRRDGRSPADRMTILMEPGEHEFDYESPSDRMRVKSALKSELKGLLARGGFQVKAA